MKQDRRNRHLTASAFGIVAPYQATSHAFPGAIITFSFSSSSLKNVKD
jgi:hypothetical protein